MSQISSNIKRLNIKENIGKIIEEKYELVLNRKIPSISVDPEIFLQHYSKTKEILNDFDITDEELIAKKFMNMYSSNLRLKCLILENFHVLNEVFNNTAGQLKRHSANTLYARVKYYKFLEEQKDKRIQNLGIGGFLYATSTNMKSKFGFDDEELIDKYPLKKSTIQAMERIHTVKKNAKNKLGGVSL